MTLIVDLFAGPGGWDYGARTVGLEPVGIELGRWACATRAAAGLRTIRADVAAIPVEPFTGKVHGLIGSPPCPAFSVAGDGRGVDLLPALCGHVHVCRDGVWRPWTGDPDPLVWLSLEPLRWAFAVQPTWIALEQVPPVLPLWQAYAHTFEHLGWHTWAGVLCAANYGVPQVRHRAFLMAHRDRQPWPPAPTHAKEPGGLFGLAPWISLADALGWTEAPSWSWGRSDGTRRRVSAAKPAHTVMGRCTTRWAYRPGGGAVLHTNRGQDEHGNRQVVTVDRAAPTVSGKASSQWVFHRPATTVAADDRIAKPGHHNWGNGRVNGEGIRVQLWELGVLQGFPADYPWQGNKTERAQQIGNAVPPPLAARVLGAVTGRGL